MLTNFAIKQYAKYRYNYLNKLKPQEAQEKELLKLIRKNETTKFGKEHSFSMINSIKDFQNNVPLRTYDDFWKEYFKDAFPYLNNITYKGLIPYYAVSSGTSTGTTKYIPLTKDMLKSNVKAGLDLLTYHFINNPNSKMLDGKSFVLGGSTDLVKEAPGIYSGDLSGITTMTIPWWIQGRYFPDKKTALLKNWEEKIDKLAKMALKEDIRMISGVPSWILIFMNKYKEIFPELLCIINNN